MSVRVRFAPSPTGSLHLGTARTAVVNWLFARSQGGQLALRFDDTDRERSSEASAEQLLADLEWLGIDWDEGPVRQSERQGAHEAALARLVDAGLTRDDDGATYMRVPQDEPLAFEDLLRGRIEFPPGSKDDFVARRSDGSFTYNFATAVDDCELAMTHVIRGEDHISNTPLQRLVIEGMGEKPPQYLHLPLLLAPDGSKLSKRHGAVSVADHRAQGFLPEALFNYLALTAFTPDREVLSREELIDAFDLNRLHRSAARFDPGKLRWLSGQHIRSCSLDEFAECLRPFLPDPDVPEAELAALQTGGDTLAECAAAARLFEPYAEPDDSAREALAADGACDALRAFATTIDSDGKLEFDAASRLLEGVRNDLKSRGIEPKVSLRAIRAALTGTTSGPELPYFLAALPREEIVRRLKRFIDE